VYVKWVFLTKYCVVGDSHTWAFPRDENMRVVEFGGATAYNLDNPDSTTQSYSKLMEAVNGLASDETLILVFGEIDCRGHIFDQHVKQNKSISELINLTIEHYGNVLKDLKDRGIKFIVYGIPPANHQGDIGWDNCTPVEERAKIYREFNTKLRSFCEKRGYKYLDIYSRTVNSEGFIKDEYLYMDVHLNDKIHPIIWELLGEKKE
jgi:hypothetical protein